MSPANLGLKSIIPLKYLLSPAKLFSPVPSPLFFPSIPSPSLPSSHSADRSERSTGVILGWALIVHVNAVREGWRERKSDGDGHCVLKCANREPGPAPPWFSPTSKLSKHTPPPPTTTNVSPLTLTHPHPPLLHPDSPHAAAPWPAWWTLHLETAPTEMSSWNTIISFGPGKYKHNCYGQNNSTARATVTLSLQATPRSWVMFPVFSLNGCK